MMVCVLLGIRREFRGSIEQNIAHGSAFTASAGGEPVVAQISFLGREQPRTVSLSVAGYEEHGREPHSEPRSLDYGWSPLSPGIEILTEAGWLPSSVRGNPFQGNRVHAVAKAAGRWAIGENVAEVRVARIAGGFDSLQETGAVKTVCDDVRGCRLRKRGPACAGLEFLGGIEQDGVAAEAGINTRLEQAAHLRTERPLGPGLAGDVVLLRAQLLPPFGVRLFDSAIRRRVAVAGKVQDVWPFQHRHYRIDDRSSRFGANGEENDPTLTGWGSTLNVTNPSSSPVRVGSLFSDSFTSSTFAVPIQSLWSWGTMASRIASRRGYLATGGKVELEMIPSNPRIPIAPEHWYWLGNDIKNLASAGLPCFRPIGHARWRHARGL